MEEETNNNNKKKIGKNDDKVESVGVGVDTRNNTSNNKMDVLLKNKFGRSALTEGFTSGDTPTVEALLNHDSAEEERLIGGLDGQDVEEGDEEVVEMNKQQEQLEGEGGGVEGGEKKKSKEKKSILHEFDFLRGEQEGQGGGGGECNDSKSVFIRELVSTVVVYMYYLASLEYIIIVVVVGLFYIKREKTYTNPLPTRHAPWISKILSCMLYL